MEKFIFPTFIIVLLYFTLFFNENSIVSAPSLLTTQLFSDLLTLRIRFLDSSYGFTFLTSSSSGFSLSLFTTTPASQLVILEATDDKLSNITDHFHLASFPGLYGLPDFSLFSKDFWGISTNWIRYVLMTSPCTQPYS